MKIHAHLESRFGEEMKLYKKSPTNEDRETKTIRRAKRDAKKEVKKANKSKNKDSIADAKKEYLILEYIIMNTVCTIYRNILINKFITMILKKFAPPTDYFPILK